jgi:bifunctional non-homologous end joining protein LigD
MKTKQYLSERDPSRDPYVTNIDPDGDFESCSCPGWLYSKEQPKKRCKHIRELRAEAASSTVQDDAGATQDPERPEVQTSGEVASAPAFLSKSGRYKPMLASPMKEGVTFAAFVGDESWVLEEKYDGHRLIARVSDASGVKAVETWSRDKERPDVPQHVIEALRDLPTGVYDGELVYVDPKTGQTGDYSDVRRKSNRPYIRLFLFDMLEAMGDPLTANDYDSRREHLAIAVAHHTMTLSEQDPQIVLLAASGPVTKLALDLIWAKSKGEGAILKRRSSLYRCGARSTEWVKVKKLGHIEATITGYKKGKNDAYGSFAIVLDDGTISAVKIATAKLKTLVLKDPDAMLQRRIVVQFTSRNEKGSLVNPVFDHFAGEGE